MHESERQLSVRMMQIARVSCETHAAMAGGVTCWRSTGTNLLKFDMMFEKASWISLRALASSLEHEMRF